MIKDQIITTVCEVCGIEPHDLTTPSREQDKAMARHLSQWFLYWWGNLSKSQIASETGVIISALYNHITPRTVRFRQKHEPLFRERFAEIEKRLKKSERNR
jgi:hypothetical protein